LQLRINGNGNKSDNGLPNLAKMMRHGSTDMNAAEVNNDYNLLEAKSGPNSHRGGGRNYLMKQ